MDILIKGLTLPKDDALSVIIYPDGVVEVQVGWNGDIPVYSNAFKATAIPVPKPIDYKTESDVLLKLWMDKIITDGEYNKIMERLNKAVVLERTT